MTAQRVTILDVAERAGVAISSVSSALNGKPGVSDDTRRRIRSIADELGFVASIRGRSLSAQRAFAAGIVVKRSPDVLEDDPFFAGFISGAEAVLARYGYALVLQMAADSEELLAHHRKLAGDRRVDGVFVFDLEIDDPRIALMADLGMPLVTVNAGVEQTAAPSVRQDHASGIRELVAHLAGLGHERIGHVAGPVNFIHSQQRESVWREAVADAGLRLGPLLRGDFTFASGERAGDELFEMEDRPTAVLCANDLMAAGAMNRLLDRGVGVPQEISIAGFDGIPMSDYLRPRLTTLRTDPHRLGSEAAQMLLRSIDGETVADVRLEAVRLRARESTGPAPSRSSAPLA